MMAASLVTGNFFQVVRVDPVMGRALAPGDDEPGGNRVVVLSDRGWNRQFNRDPKVLGRTVLVRGEPFEIIGVMPAAFRGLEVSAPDLWAPLAQLGCFQPADRGREDSAGVGIVGRLRPGVSMEAARAQIAAWDANRQARLADRRAETIVLVPRRGTLPQPLEAIALFTPLFFAFGLILLIGCANVANLLLARGVARQREIGVRLSLGASRRRIVRQFMTESWLLALAAAVGGYVVSRVALGGLVYFASQAMPMDLGDTNLELSVPPADWRVAAFLVVTAMAATAFFALMPALRATRIEPLRTLRGEMVGNAGPGRARNALIGIQVFASALLLVCAAIFLRSAIASARFDPGFRTADTVMIQIANEPKRAAMVQAIASEPTVTAYAACTARHPGLAASGRRGDRRQPNAGWLQVRLVRVLRRVRHSHRAGADVHRGGGRRRIPGRHRHGIDRTGAVAGPERRRRDVPARAGSRFRSAARGRTADASAPRHGGGRLARRRRLPIRRHPGSRHLPANQRQRAGDGGRGARQGRIRAGPPDARRSPHPRRSEHGPRS